MSKNNFIIINEKNRPYWQVLLAAFFFTASLAYFAFYIYNTHWSDDNIRYIGQKFEVAIYLFAIGIAFSFQKCIYINTKEMLFRSTFKVGPVSFGEWKNIPNPEYVSIFKQPLINGKHIFEVNLWYQKNKHWELYEKYDFMEAYKIGFQLSEELNIDLLDATEPNNHKWVDKQSTLESGEIQYLD